MSAALPRYRDVDPRPPQASGAHFTPRTGKRSRPRVLIADDHEDTRHMYAWCMRAAGWAVAEAADGFEALTVAATFEPDAVVMDLYLPVLGGVDAIRRLRSEMADRDLTIVACSGVPRADLQDEALDAGCDAFVAKPCLPDDMCDLLEELVLARARSR